MKKVLILLIILLICLTGCNREITKTCEISTNEYKQKWTYKVDGEKINKIELNITYDNSIFGNVESFASLTKNEEQELKKAILSNLGFDKDSYDGFKIDILVNDNINVKVKIDIEKADKELLSKIGLDLDQNRNIDSTIVEMKENGATCR